MATKPSKAQRRARAAMWHALKSAAKSECGDASRALLEPGTVRVALSINGSIGRSKVSEHVAGDLTTGSDSTRSATSTPDYLAVIGRLLSGMPATRRDELLATLPQEYTVDGVIECSDERRQEAKQLCEQLRSRGEQKVRGSVRLQRTAPA